MAKNKGTHFIVTASTTEGGAPTYLKADGNWSPRLQDAQVLASEEQANLLVQRADAEQQRWVADPYSFMVLVENGQIDPMSARENIRANGPSVRVRRPD